MDMANIFTRERAELLFEKIAKRMEEDKVEGSNNIIAYAMKESWLDGFEEGRKYPLKELV